MRDSKQFQTRRATILYFLRGSWRFFLPGILFASLVSLADLVSPKIVEYAVDSVIGEKQLAAPGFVQRFVTSLGGTAYLRTHLVYLALIVLVVALIGALCRYLFSLFNSMGAERFVCNMRDGLFSHIVRLPFSWHSENHTGDIIQRCTSDVETIKLFVSEHLIMLFRVVLLIILSMFFMVRIHLGLAIAEALFIPVIVIGSIYFHVKIGDSFEKVDSEEGRLSSIAQENLTGVRVVRAFGREIYERTRFEKQNEHYTGLWFHLMRILASFWVYGNVIARVRDLTIILAGMVFCIRGSLSPGGYIAFISYNALLALPVRRLGRVIAEMSKAGISVDRIRYICEAAEETGLDETGALSGDVSFSHVSFAYPGTTERVLDDVSFEVKQGQTIGILGATGSGKTTLAELFDRLYELPKGAGEIRIGGRDIREIPLGVLRRNIGFVLQEPYLFSRTLEDNIRIARDDADSEEVMRASRIASLDEAVAQFSKGYKTFVGERGVTLSGGQRQRAAIAQMLVRKTPYMVFDDALSAVDAETDTRIREAMQSQIEDATVFLIAHRVTTLMQADLILVIEDGRIKERGTHEELIEAGGLYQRIYEYQCADAGEVAL